MGIPIGPDTSLLIAEILLSAVDKKIKRKVSTVRAFRFIDDYELAVSSRDHAEIALAAVQEAMSEYELALSPEKTTIAALPCSLDEDWLSPLRDFTFAQSAARQGTELIAYFNKAYTLTKEFRDKPVLAYAVARLRSVVVQPTNWDLFQDLLFQSVLAEPGTLPPVLAQLVRYRDGGLVINTSTLTDVANLQIAYQAPLGHASEVGWALWTILAFRLTVKPAAAKAISLMSDSVVALLAMDALDQGLVTSALSTDLWESYLTTDHLYGEQWLLSYEASVKGWLTGQSGVDHIAGDPNFNWLRSIGVEFYDGARTRPIQPGDAVDEDEAISDLDAAVAAMVDPYGPEAEDGLGDTELSELLQGGENDSLTSDELPDF
jgi:hypothetical protein